MIESRYKIEYVLPNEKKSNSSSFKFLWYLITLLFVLILITVITYDFSLEDISRDSKRFAEKTKEIIFNLEHKNKENNILNDSQIVDRTNSTNETTSLKKIKKPLIDSNKKIIQDLTKKQQEQIDKNPALVDDLQKISSQLKIEKIKNKELNVQLSAQKNDRQNLEEKHAKVLEEVTINKEKLEGLTKQKEMIAAESKQTKQDQFNEMIIDPEPTSTAISQASTDKIIEAMDSLSSTNSDNSNKDETKKIETLENKKSTNQVEKVNKNSVEDSKINLNTNRKESTHLNSEAVVNQPLVINKETTNLDVKIKEEKPLNKQTIDVESATQISDIAEKKKTEKEPIEKENKINSDPKQLVDQNSSVNDIIATMQGLQPNNKETSDSDEEKDIEKVKKQQLVEQGDRVIEN